YPALFLTKGGKLFYPASNRARARRPFQRMDARLERRGRCGRNALMTHGLLVRRLVIDLCRCPLSCCR
ncbi:hypothetical protein, partial [Streptomyces sp. NPDC047123]|uniref:hypothetical protein n=1 Tax=Streptomyces sp. NPDC047123 TaxID=3155622 RepID=UPI003411513E